MVKLWAIQLWRSARIRNMKSIVLNTPCFHYDSFLGRSGPSPGVPGRTPRLFRVTRRALPRRVFTWPRQSRRLLARLRKNEVTKNDEFLIGFSFVSRALYHRINWSERETCTLKYAWQHISSSGQTNCQTLSNSTLKVTQNLQYERHHLEHTLFSLWLFPGAVWAIPRRTRAHPETI